MNICINVTLNCNSKNEVKSEILSILHFASKIDASVKFTEIFPLTQDLSISGNSGDYIARCLYNHKFNLTCDKGRKLEFNNGTTTCSINRIFCAYASKEKDPIHVCQTTNDYFVSSMGIIKFCRFDQSQTSIYSAVKERRDELILKALCFRKKYAIDNCIRHLSELEELKS